MSVQVEWLALAILSAAPTVAGSQAKPDRPVAWSDSIGEATALRASITVPKQAGTLPRLQTRDLGDNGVDLVAQYASPDEQVFGTIFIYKPTLPDSGLAFLATDEAIRRRFGEGAKTLDDRLVRVGGVAKAGRRVIYASSDARLGSSALIVVQAGGWMVKIRVSGPTDRAEEISINLDALAAGLKFGKGSEPLPAHIIQTEPCGGASAPANSGLVKPQSADAAAIAIMAIPVFIDENGRAVADLTERVPDRLCLAESSSDGKVPLLTFRTVKSTAAGIFEPKIFQLYGDAGQIIEVTRALKGSNENYALRHGIGRLIVYGGFASEPSADQLSMIRRLSDQLPVIAIIQAYGGGTNTEIFCNSFAEGCAKEK
ncbi:MAG: hypothetical protein M3Q19_12235 [Pseudomonadota bacterium]|nr:hypothetical protein [Pseudomonadota bacterium]